MYIHKNDVKDAHTSSPVTRKHGLYLILCGWISTTKGAYNVPIIFLPPPHQPQSTQFNEIPFPRDSPFPPTHLSSTLLGRVTPIHTIKILNCRVHRSTQSKRPGVFDDNAELITELFNIIYFSCCSYCCAISDFTAVALYRKYR